jgi:transposase
MEKYGFFVGIDVSGDHLDYCLRNISGRLGHLRAPNTAEGVGEAVAWMRGFPGFKPGACLACLEHTGIYGLFALHGLHGKGFGVWHEAAASIKNGAGRIHRGKSDKVDAARIADYAFTFRHRARPWEPPRAELALLADLMALRGRLMEVSVKLRVPAGEIRRFKGAGRYKAVNGACARTAAAAKAELKALEKRIMALIAGDPALARLYRLATSVRGVGFVTATALIIATNEFKDISDPRKLACHAGVAPFEHSSGSRAGRGGKVSQRADKRLKALLHVCATNAIKVPGELRDYFDRKIAAGKNKYVVLNALRNKIIHRVCACVRDGREYTGTLPGA